MHTHERKNKKMSNDTCPQFNWDNERDYYRKLLEPAVGKTVVLFGRFAARNHGWFEGGRYRKGNVCFTDIRPFNPHRRMGLLCHHLNLAYENLVDEGISPGMLQHGAGYILAGIIRRYGEGRYGLQVDPNLTLPPVSKRGPFDCAYLRLAQSPSSYDFANLAG